METDSLRKHLQQYTFRENNGKILRYVNMMKPKESTVGNIRFLMQGETQEDLVNSLNYLTEAGYIRIEGPRGSRSPASLMISARATLSR